MTSPCINAGTNGEVTSTIDLDGNPRIEEGTVDMGCYELRKAPQPSVPQNVIATDGIYSDKITITWNQSTHATKYFVYRNSLNSTNGAVNISGSISNTNYNDTTAIAGQTYYYWLKAGSSNGWSELSENDSGYALASQNKPTVNGKWKYKSKNGKAKLLVKGIGLDLSLENYLEDGCLVGLKDAANYETVDGPRKLEPKKKKNGDIKFWYYNVKKTAVIKYKPNDKPGKDKLIYKVWKNLPQEIIFFVQPPAEDGGDSDKPANYVEPVYELYLSPGAKMKNGWRELEKNK